MSQALRKLTATIGKSRTILIFINQIRMKIGMMFGNPETTTGGNALKFYSSVRLDVRKAETIEGSGTDSDAIGNRVRVKVVKNKVAPPFRKCELEIIFGKGISPIASLLDAAIKYEIIDKKGSWFSYGMDKIAQGREASKAYLQENEIIRKEIEDKLRVVMFPARQQAKTAEKSGASKADGSAVGKSPEAAGAPAVKPARAAAPVTGDAAKRPAGRPRKNPDEEENPDEPLF
jgi:recombination protein RecA